MAAGAPTVAFLGGGCNQLYPAENAGLFQRIVAAGGVVVSALEMVQNSVRYSWSRKEVDDRLRSIMNNIYDLSAAAAAEYDLGYDLIAGSDIAAFKKISEAMIAQGL